jgi:hypothetical protein
MADRETEHDPRQTARVVAATTLFVVYIITGFSTAVRRALPGLDPVTLAAAGEMQPDARAAVAERLLELDAGS